MIYRSQWDMKELPYNWCHGRALRLVRARMSPAWRGTHPWHHMKAAPSIESGRF